MMGFIYMLVFSLFTLASAALAPTCSWTNPPQITDLSASESTVTVQWSHATNNGFTISGYDLAYATPKATTWKTSTTLSTLPAEGGKLPSFTEYTDDTYWTSDNVFSASISRYDTFTASSGSLYRVKVRAKSSSCSDSSWSDSKVIALSSSEKVVLTVRGTGSNNHLPAEVHRNSFTILKRDDFRGLYMHVFTRYDMTSVYSGFYDTAASAEDSESMADKIALYDSTHLIVIVSCSYWETNVTDRLIKALEKCGAILVNEATSPLKHRPYAFVGIPELGKSQGHIRETLRTNKGYYLYDPRSSENLPSADLRVVLIRNPWRQFYFMMPFDTWRKVDPIEDYYGSLSYQLELLMEANETTTNNLGFTIKTSYSVYYDGRADKITELDTVWAGDAVVRYDFDKQKYSEGLDVDKLAWTPAVKAILKGEVCDPPYTDASNAACYMGSVRETILQCGVGITPWDCAYLGQSQVSQMYS
mmetsp:Transcript_27408/g.49337  ORF Transcript_27408/g.49337 Transcript_27408/m.49337 type:complete len:474 (-) Transcript_27408:1526-2947(-)